MNRISPLAYEVTLRTETIVDGLKNLSISYALPRGYQPNSESLTESEIKYGSLTNALANIALAQNGQKTEEYYLTAGFVLRFSDDDLLHNMPAYAAYVDPQALLRHSNHFHPFLGADITTIFCKMVLTNNVGPQRGIARFDSSNMPYHR